MDLYNNGTNKKKKPQSVQDISGAYNGGSSRDIYSFEKKDGPGGGADNAAFGQERTVPIHRSGYKGPYKTGPIRRTVNPENLSLNNPGTLDPPVNKGMAAAAEKDGKKAGAGLFATRGRQKTNEERKPVSAVAGGVERVNGINFKEPVSIIYFSILGVCLVTALVAGAFSNSGKGTLDTRYGFSDKMARKIFAVRDTVVNMPTVMGLVPELLDIFIMGDQGKTEEQAGTQDMAEGGDASSDGTISTTNEPDASQNTASSGNAMILDKGQGSASYPEATSHAELMTQLESALASGDYNFVGTKLAYKDDYGELKGYPQSVISHFTEYMASNADKRSEFISQVSNEGYSAMNDSAYIALLPVIQFTVNMAYDDTTVSVPGFGDQIVNSGQSAVIKPLLPCMYSVTLSNDMWSAPVTKEIETSLDELSYSLSIS